MDRHEYGNVTKLEGGLRVTKGMKKMDRRGIPLVSIITICKNSERFIEQSILSVLQQSYEDIEYIIVDGGSEDGTIDIIREYENRIDYWLSERDQGISDAFNKGIGKSTGDIIGILNSDDWYELDAVETVVKNRSSFQIVYGKTAVVRRNGGRGRIEIGKELRGEITFFNLVTPHPSVFCTRKVYEEVGLYDLEYKHTMDMEFLLRAVRRYEPHFIDKVLANFRTGGVSMKALIPAKREVLRLLREKENMGLHYQCYYLLRSISAQVLMPVRLLIGGANR